MEKNDIKKRVLTAQEVSDYLRIPLSTVYFLAVQGRLRGVKLGRQWRFLEEDVASYLYGIKPSSTASEKLLSTERRTYSRINSEIPTKLKVLLAKTKNISIEGSISNLSEGGAFFVPLNEDFEIGDPVQVTFKIPSDHSSVIELEGRIIHRLKNGKSGVGIKFRHASDETREVVRDYVD